MTEYCSFKYSSHCANWLFDQFILYELSAQIEDMRGLKIDMNFFLKILNDERLVDLKHKPLEDKEVTKIVGHQELSIQER